MMLHGMRPDHGLLPSVYASADEEWIKQQLLSLTPAARQKAIQRYAAVYQESFEAEPVPYRKENRARHEANVRLRRFVDAHGRALQGIRPSHPGRISVTIRWSPGLKVPGDSREQSLTVFVLCTSLRVHGMGKREEGVGGVGS